MPSTRSEVCWAAVSQDDRYAYVTNFGDGTISSYTIGDDGDLSLLAPVAATTVDGQKGIRDEAFSADGEYLYALHADVAAGSSAGRWPATARSSPSVRSATCRRPSPAWRSSERAGTEERTLLGTGPTVYRLMML